jgi:2-polyprenyl-6-methoxyphenol hydroxylase-like FAD-dependent oxidoreductase
LSSGQPTGLVLGLWLTLLWVRVRIIDKTSEPGTTSRAVAVQARTLELYRQIGLADAVVAGGRQVPAVNLWVAGKQVAHAVLSDMSAGISPFPYALIYPQDEHERLLINRLAETGVEVERETELVTLEETAGRMLVRLERTDGATEACEVAYLAGCDGAHSTVLETLANRDHAFDHVKTIGIQEVLTAPGSPWQNAYVERFIGSVRRECLDHVIVLTGAGLRRVLHEYVAYYSRTRTHPGLNKDAPVSLSSRATDGPCDRHSTGRRSAPRLRAYRVVLVPSLSPLAVVCRADVRTAPRLSRSWSRQTCWRSKVKRCGSIPDTVASFSRFGWTY